MDHHNNSTTMLEMFLHPVFRVQNGVIVEANASAQQHGIPVGTAVHDLLISGHQEYDTFTGGCLSLSLAVENVSHIAVVLRCDDSDLFHLRSDSISAELRCLALAAQNINKPLSNILHIADQLLSNDCIRNDPNLSSHAAQINRALFQLMRIVKNMESSGGSTILANPATADAVSVFNEVLQKASSVALQSNRTINIKLPTAPVYCMIDDAMMERAIYNLVSNAIKFSPENSAIQIELSPSKDKLRFSVSNQHDRKGNDLIGTIYSRYLRAPGIEDGRNGLGLGIPLVQAVAAYHGGTLLMDQPTADTIRLTMTIAVRTNKPGTFSNNIMLFDYAGGYDRALLELSDVLDLSAYTNIN